MNKEYLAKIRELLEILPKSKWKYDCGNLEVELYDGRNHVCSFDKRISHTQPEFNMIGSYHDYGDFIEMSRNSMPDILSYIEKLEKRNQIMREALEFYATEFNWHTMHETKCEDYNCCHKEKYTIAKEALKKEKEVV